MPRAAGLSRVVIAGAATCVGVNAGNDGVAGVGVVAGVVALPALAVSEPLPEPEPLAPEAPLTVVGSAEGDAADVGFSVGVSFPAPPPPPQAAMTRVKTTAPTLLMGRIEAGIERCIPQLSARKQLKVSG